MGVGQSAAKQHEKRVNRCLQSFQQLQADIRHINLHCAAEFARPAVQAEGAAAGGEESEPLIIQFRPYTKLSKKSSIPWLWKLNDNVIVTATVTPKRQAEAYLAAAIAASTGNNGGATAAAPAALVATPAVAVAAAVAAVVAPPASSSSSPSSSSSSSPSSLAPTPPVAVPPLSSCAASTAASGGLPLPPTGRSYTLTLREFYTLFLHWCDNLRLASTLRDQILKIEHPAIWAAKQEARRKEQLLHQQRSKKAVAAAIAAGTGDIDTASMTMRKDGAPAGGGEVEEEKEEKSSSSSSAVAVSAPDALSRGNTGGSSSTGDSSSFTVHPSSGSLLQECCICLTAPDEDALGEELVVLSCLHCFCSECISEWRKHSPTCPLCRRELSQDEGGGGEEDSLDAWILTSPNLVELKNQHQKLLDFAFDFVAARPAFPPPRNPAGGTGAANGARNAGDVFSVIVGEVVDAFTPGRTPANQQQQQQQQPRRQSVPVAAAAVAAAPPAVASSPSQTAAASSSPPTTKPAVGATNATESAAQAPMEASAAPVGAALTS